MRGIPARVRALGIVALSGVHAFASAEEPAATSIPSPLKDGWSDAQVTQFTEGCIAGILVPARRDYAARAAAAGDASSRPFPEEALRASIAPMCSCIALRIANTWAFAEFSANPRELSKPLIEESLAGGQCKPGGMLGDILAAGKNDS